MGIVWSAKDSKDPPLVSADEFLILDSEDATLSTKNKRVTLATVQANLVTSVDANDFNITKLNSISINDSANDNTFTISSSVDLAADRTINLPLLTADDTFAMLGVSNTFLEDNTFEKNILLVSDISCTSIFTTVAANNGLGGRLVGQFLRGTIASPLAIQNGDRLYVLLAAGFDGTIVTNAASLIWGADGNWTGSNHGSSLTFTTTPTNTILPLANIIIKNKVISFEDNDLDNIKSIKLNDASDDNKFTILGAELTTDRTATIPPLSADDTFAMLGVNNTFTGANTWTDDLVQLEDNTSQNANFTGEVFSTTTVEKTGFQGFRAAGTKAIPAATTSGSVIVDLDAVGFDGTNFSIGGSAGFDTPATWSGTSTPVRFSIFTTNIDSTTNVENFVIDADGTADFKGNNITNAVIQSNLTDGSILVGNESNVSKDFPAKLQTKADCDVATTVSGDLATSFEAGDMIDTVTLDVGDRILIKDQDTSTENGIYTVNSSGPPTRAADANEDSEVNNGMFTKIIDGSANINTAFVLSTPDNITLGVTDLTFDEFSFSDIAHLNQNSTFTSGVGSVSEDVADGDAFSSQLFSDTIATITNSFRSIRAGGSQDAPTNVKTGMGLGGFSAEGFNTTSIVVGGRLHFTANGNWSETSQPTQFRISTTDVNESTPTTRLRVDSDGGFVFFGNELLTVGKVQFFGNIAQEITSSTTQLSVITNSGGDILLKETTTELFKINETEGLVASRRIQKLKGTDVVSADAITLGDGNFFDITGMITINHMINTNWQSGSVVTLQFDAILTVKNAATGAISPEADFALAGGLDFISGAGDTLTLVFNGTVWFEIARNVISIPSTQSKTLTADVTISTVTGTAETEITGLSITAPTHANGKMLLIYSLIILPGSNDDQFTIVLKRSGTQISQYTANVGRDGELNYVPVTFPVNTDGSTYTIFLSKRSGDVNFTVKGTGLTSTQVSTFEIP